MSVCDKLNQFFYHAMAVNGVTRRGQKITSFQCKTVEIGELFEKVEMIIDKEGESRSEVLCLRIKPKETCVVHTTNGSVISLEEFKFSGEVAGGPTQFMSLKK